MQLLTAVVNDKTIPFWPSFWILWAVIALVAVEVGLCWLAREEWNRYQRNPLSSSGVRLVLAVAPAAILGSALAALVLAVMAQT